MPQNQQKKLGYRPIRRCYWFSKFVCLANFGRFCPFLGIFFTTYQLISLWCAPESTKKTLAIDLYEGAIEFQSLYVWLILAIFGHFRPFLSIFSPQDIVLFTFYYLSSNFSLMCPRINKKTLAIDLYKGAIDFQNLCLAVWPF